MNPLYSRQIKDESALTDNKMAHVGGVATSVSISGNSKDGK